MKTVMDNELYKKCIDKILNSIMTKSDVRQAFYNEVLLFMYSIDPIFPLAPAIDANVNRYIKIFRKALNLEKSSLLPEGMEMFVLNDVFFQLAQRLKNKELLSILINLYWQEVFIARFIYAHDLKTNSDYLLFYFRYHNTVTGISKIKTEDGKLLFSLESYFLMLSHTVEIDKKGIPPSIAKVIEKKIVHAQDYPLYIFTVFYSPIPEALFQRLDDKSEQGTTDEKLALIYYFRRTNNDNFVRYFNIDDDEMLDMEEENYLEEWNQSLHLYAEAEGDERIHAIIEQENFFKQKATNELRKYQKILRSLLIEYYQASSPVLVELKVFLQRNPELSRELKKRIGKAVFFKDNRQAVEELLFLINGCGGLNLFQLNSLNKLEEAGIDYPPGYITQDLRSK